MENLNNFVKGEFTGRPSDIKVATGAIGPVTEQEARTIEGIVCYFLKIRGQWYLTPQCASSLNKVFLTNGKGSIPGAPEQVIKPTSSKVVSKEFPMVNWHGLKALRRYLRGQGASIVFFAGEKPVLPYLLAMFADNAFKQSYEYYKLLDFDQEWKLMDIGSLDEGTQLTDINVQDFCTRYLEALKQKLPLLQIPTRSNNAKSFDIVETDTIALSIALCTAKNFVDLETQYDNYMKKRISAFQNSLGYVPDEERMLQILDKQSLTRLSKHMTIYPNFKKTIYQYLLDCTSGQLGAYAATILSESQATIYTFIVSFVYGNRKTKAHFDPRVIEQVNRFCIAHEKILERHGDNYKYIKLINPEESTIQNNRWPLLGALAVLYAAVVTRQGSTMRNLRFLRRDIPRTLVQALAYELDEKHYLENTQSGNFKLSEAAIKAYGVKNETLEYKSDPAAIEACIAECSELLNGRQ